MRRPRVEILYFEECPNHGAARELVERIAAELRVEPEIHLVEVADADAAKQLRFLGSPTIRVDGRDVEPGAEERHEFVLSCRVYPSERGFSGQPEARWIRETLEEAAT
jgi:predicted RNA-binding protein with PIN domain